MDRAKELFFKYNGNRFYMDHNGEGYEYDKYHISRETEEKWAEEYILGFLDSKKHGKEAVRGYSAVAELLKSSTRSDILEKCLYYPLRARHLDDISILFMLPNSFSLAERTLKKGSLIKQDAVAYILDLDRYITQVQKRADNGTLTRDTDYSLQEFSDPVYVNNYLYSLRKKWDRLF